MSDEVTVIGLDEAVSALRDGEAMRIVDPQEAQRAMVARIFEAESVEEILDNQPALSGRDLLDVPLRIRGVMAMRSAFPEGPGVFLVLTADRADTDGEVRITTGSVTCMAQVLRAAQLDELPLVCKFVEVQSASNPELTALNLAHAVWPAPAAG